MLDLPALDVIYYVIDASLICFLVLAEFCLLLCIGEIILKMWLHVVRSLILVPLLAVFSE